MLLQKSTSNIPALWDMNKTSPLKMSDWIDEVFEDALNWTRNGNGSSFVPELNVYETDKEFEVAVALPGMKKNDFEISYNSGLLTISGERKMEHEDNGRRYHRIESRFGKFTRTMPLPADVVNADKITARYENGVLNVTIPKIAEKAAKRIEIQ